jgi:hypothetical protein
MGLVVSFIAELCESSFIELKSVSSSNPIIPPKTAGISESCFSFRTVLWIGLAGLSVSFDTGFAFCTDGELCENDFEYITAVFAAFFFFTTKKDFAHLGHLILRPLSGTRSSSTL